MLRQTLDEAAPLHHVPVLRPSRTALSFSERRLLLALVDLLLINSALLITLEIEKNFARDISYLSWFLLLNTYWLVSSTIFNIYDLVCAASMLNAVRACSEATLVTATGFFLTPLITPNFPVRRLEIVVFLALMLGSISSWRIFYARVLVQPSFARRTLVIGAGYAGRTLAQAILRANGQRSNTERGSGYAILGFIDDDPEKVGHTIEHSRVLGGRNSLLGLVQLLHPNELIIAITHQETMQPELFEAILACREMGISITTMATVYENLTGRVPLEHTGRALNVVLPLTRPATHYLYLALRRGLDLLVGLVGCGLLLALIGPIWVANRLFSPGPLFYRQERIGKGGKVFSIIKFRSMVADAEKYTGAVWAAEKDPRITPLGHFLRKTRLDEVPQFWNILKGDMSLIGPRPERPHFVVQLAQQLPYYRARHAVKPGLTGWAQVKYRYTSSLEDSLVKLQYDLYYIKRQSLFVDIQILLHTVGVVLGFKGR